MRPLRTVVAAGVGLLLMAAVAAAHTPIFLADQLDPGVHERAPIKNPEQSWAIYGRLGPGRTADMIPIEAKQGQKLYIQLLVPQRAKDFHPKGVLLGPGLARQTRTDLPVVAAAGQGGLPLAEPSEHVPLHEGFTQIDYWVAGTLNGTFPASGRYGLVIYDPSGRGGPYTVAIGQKEKFGPLDILTFPLVWTRAHVWLWK